jgi:acyl-CoA reductase-like NAD-dependent aldehyde dehydrogenase
LDGKKAIVAMETGDCDAAVDAALCALKSSSASTGSGLYFLVQDSERDEIIWRLRERFEKCRSGDWLDKMTDFPDHQRFEAPKEVGDYFNETRLDVIINLILIK